MGWMKRDVAKQIRDAKLKERHESQANLLLEKMDNIMKRGDEWKFQYGSVDREAIKIAIETMRELGYRVKHKRAYRWLMWK